MSTASSAARARLTVHCEYLVIRFAVENFNSESTLNYSHICDFSTLVAVWTPLLIELEFPGSLPGSAALAFFFS